MDIQELIKKVQTDTKTRTHEQRVKLLKNAKIIDKNGYFCEKFFSKETVRQDRQAGIPVKA